MICMQPISGNCFIWITSSNAPEYILELIKVVETSKIKDTYFNRS